MSPSAALRVADQLDFGELVGNHLQPYHQQHGRPSLLHHDMGTGHAGALVDDVLAEAAQARHRADEADFRQRLLDGILGHAQRAGDGQVAHVVLHQRVEQLCHHAAQAFAVTAGRGTLPRVRNGTPRAPDQQQSDDRPVLHRHLPQCPRSFASVARSVYARSALACITNRERPPARTAHG